MAKLTEHVRNTLQKQYDHHIEHVRLALESAAELEGLAKARREKAAEYSALASELAAALDG